MAEGNAEGTVNLSIDLEDPRALITKFVSRHREVPELQVSYENAYQFGNHIINLLKDSF